MSANNYMSAGQSRNGAQATDYDMRGRSPDTGFPLPYARLTEEDKRDIARMVVEMLRAEATGPGKR